MSQSTRKLPARSGGWLTQISTWPKFYALMVFAWLFDFRAETSGAGLVQQSLFLGLFLFGLAMFYIGDTNQRMKVRGLFPFGVACLLYLTIGFVAGLANNQTYYAILRNGLSVFIYFAMAIATARVMIVTRAEVLRLMLSVFCLGFAVMFYFYETISRVGVDVNSVRYQIIGTSSIAALGYLALALLFRLSRIEMIATAANGVLLLISVTRLFLLAGAAQVAAIALEFRRSFSPRMLLAGGLLVIAAIGTTIFASEQLLRWQDRLLGRGSNRTEYVTVYTRLSEVDYMYNHWLATPSTMMFGNGFAARTLYYYPPETRIPPESMIGFGHNQYVSMLFTGGMVGGGPLILLQILHGLIAFQFLRRVARNGHLRSDVVFLGAWGATIILGMLAANLFSSSFGLRGTSLWYGLGTGLLLGARALFDPENYPRSRAKSPLHLRRPTP